MDWKTALREVLHEARQEVGPPMFVGGGMLFGIGVFTGLEGTDWVVAAASVVAAVVGAALTLSTERERRAAEPTLLQRVDKSFVALREAAAVVSALEREIATTAERTKEAQQQLEHSRRAPALSDEDAAAMQTMIGQQFRRERRPTMVQNAVFMLLGLGLGELIDMVRG